MIRSVHLWPMVSAVDGMTFDAQAKIMTIRVGPFAALAPNFVRNALLE